MWLPKIFWVFISCVCPLYTPLSCDFVKLKHVPLFVCIRCHHGVMFYQYHLFLDFTTSGKWREQIQPILLSCFCPQQFSSNLKTDQRFLIWLLKNQKLTDKTDPCHSWTVMLDVPLTDRITYFCNGPFRLVGGVQLQKALRARMSVTSEKIKSENTF